MSNEEIVKMYFGYFLKGDTAKALELLNDNAVWLVKGSQNVPTVGRRKGKDEIVDFFRKFTQNFEPKEFNIKHYFAKENLVIVIGDFTHFVKPTSKLVSSDWMIEFIVEEGKICSYRILEDSYALYLAFLND
ncbi:hypothetical protein CLV62_10430 [Dysgonomonas alginatilytica]|uniref:SnoaL-like domain-containing protein n=1 Tax=Dysgonomonas alginatilytica TaxID=1605892 RepID=A0A2V3PR09_9BACT|nr:nuclear transport factor 2 family protein [Dysgonomonas alginatilytica]PXV66770.1 hypothetical protein CLV62_10430 [Dysgonomonas alginatilytica]